MYNVNDKILQKKKINIIDPFYSIDKLLKDISDFENEKKALMRENNRILKKLEK